MENIKNQIEQILKSIPSYYGSQNIESSNNRFIKFKTDEILKLISDNYEPKKERYNCPECGGN
jgi:hypothetical protein